MVEHPDEVGESPEQLPDESGNIKVLGFGVAYTRCLTVYTSYSR